MASWTVGTNLWIAFVLPVSIPVRSAVVQNLVLRADNAVIIRIVHINSMKIYQEEKLAQMSVVQLEKLEQIANNQSNALTQISVEFQDEKNVLEEKTQILMQRLKLSYAIAGSAVAISIIQFLLNLLGVL